MTSPLAFAPVVRTRLANGLTVLVRRDDSAPVAAVVTHVRAGYFDETDDVVGVAHVLEHMYFKGTPSRGPGEIARATKASGGYLNAHTIYDHTSYYAVLPARGFAAGLAVQADAYANSLVDAHELARELEVIVQEARRKADAPSAVATETLYELLHDRHRMRRWRIGRETGLRALTRDDVLRFYRNFYRPAATILVIVGDVDVDDTMRQVEALYGALPLGAPERSPGPNEEEAPGFRARELVGDIAQTQLVFGWRTPGTLHPDTPLLELAATVLGVGRASRLYRAVRERQLAQTISAYDYTPTELGVFAVHAETPPAQARAAARATWAQIGLLRAEGVGALELARAQRVLEARWLRGHETMEGQAMHLAEWEALGDWSLGERYLERVLTARPEAVSDAVRAYLDPAQASVLVYRPRDAEPLASGADAMRTLLDDAPEPSLPPTPPLSARASPAPVRSCDLEREESGVRVYRSSSGVPILVRRKRGAPMVHVGVFARGGAGLEPADRAGLTMLLARTAVKGTARRTAGQIAEEAELLGGSVGGSASADGLGWTISVPTRHAAAAMDLLADVALHPVIPVAAFETERAVALAAVASLRDDMYRYPMRLAIEAAYAGHPYGQPALGTESSLRAVSAEEVRGWHASRVLAAPCVLAVVGDVDADEVAAWLSRDFAVLTAGREPTLAPPVWPAAVTSRVERREKAQTALAVLFPGPARRDGDRYAAELLAGIASGLGGRFFDELRDRRSLAYTVHVHSSARELSGTIAAYIATSPGQEEEARRGLLAEFAKLRDAPVTEDELARAQAYAIGANAIREQSAGAVLGDLVDAWLFGDGLGELAARDACIRAVTARDVLDLARRDIDESRYVEGVVRGTGRTV